MFQLSCRHPTDTRPAGPRSTEMAPPRTDMFRGGAAKGGSVRRDMDHQGKPPKGQPVEGCCWTC